MGAFRSGLVGEAGEPGIPSPALLSGVCFWYACIALLTPWLARWLCGNREWGLTKGHPIHLPGAARAFT
jgi:hypothetical protein